MVEDDFTDKEFVDEGDDDVDFFNSRDDIVEDANDADNGSYSKGAPATKRKRKRKKGATTKTGGKQAAKRNKEKVSTQQRHAYALQGVQRALGEGRIPLQRLRQGSAGELPLALPHLSSQQRICIDNGNKLISIKLTII